MLKDSGLRKILSAQQTHDEMQDDLWNALLEAHRSDAALTANVKRHGAGRVEGLPIIDPPTVLSRNQLMREDHPYYIAAGFFEIVSAGARRLLGSCARASR